VILRDMKVRFLILCLSVTLVRFFCHASILCHTLNIILPATENANIRPDDDDEGCCLFVSRNPIGISKCQGHCSLQFSEQGAVMHWRCHCTITTAGNDSDGFLMGIVL